MDVTMDEGNKDTTAAQPASHEVRDVVYGHQACQTRNARWLCLDNVYEKLYRPNMYDIGGTYIEDVADFWFMYQTEQCGNLFLIHLFITNRSYSSYTVHVSSSNILKVDKKTQTAYLPTSLKQFCFKDRKDMSLDYLTTYSFSDLDIMFLKDRKLYIAISFKVEIMERNLNQSVIEDVKLSHDFRELLNDPIGSDFTIQSADGDSFKVHKVLLIAHSDVFKAMLKEDTAESQNNFVQLVDVSTEDLRNILEFVYTGTVIDLNNCNFFNLLTLADQYNLIGLRDLSEYCLSQQLTMENVLMVLVMADMHNASTLKTSALKFIKKNVSVLKTDSFKDIKSVELVQEICTYLVSN